MEEAWLETKRPFFHSQAHKALVPRASAAARKAGLVYEKKVQEKVKDEFAGWKVLCGPWLRFYTIEEGNGRVRRKERWCQPDCLVLAQEHVIIFEVKVRHTERAWWQLFALYGPVCVTLWKKRVILVEVTKSFDAGVSVPGEYVPAWNWKEAKKEIVRIGKKEGSSEMILLQWRPGE